jgi:hypothetical protein
MLENQLSEKNCLLFRNDFIKQKKGRYFVILYKDDINS